MVSGNRQGQGGGRGFEYEQVGSEYMDQRQLKSGAAGWLLLAGLGVAYVISGDFAGWNFGLAEGGWGGLLIATILMATMYTAMVFGLAEMASALPVAGAGYGFARRALGPLGGFATGTGDPDRVRHRAGRRSWCSSAATSRRSACSG
jgi:ethanolamine permease